MDLDVHSDPMLVDEPSFNQGTRCVDVILNYLLIFKGLLSFIEFYSSQK